MTVPPTIEARCRKKDRHFLVSIVDLTSHGCLLSSPIISLAVGERISIDIDGIKVPDCRINWVKGHVCSVGFAHPLHDSVLAHLKPAAPSSIASQAWQRPSWDLARRDREFFRPSWRAQKG